MKPFRETGGVSSVLFPKGLSSRTAWQDSGALPNLPFLGSPQCGRSSKLVQNILKLVFLLQHPSSCGPKTKTAKPCQPLVLVVELQIWVANFGPRLGRLKISTVDWFLGTCSTHMFQPTQLRPNFRLDLLSETASHLTEIEASPSFKNPFWVNWFLICFFLHGWRFDDLSATYSIGESSWHVFD